MYSQRFFPANTRLAHKSVLCVLTPAHKDWVYSCPLRGLGGGGRHKACGCSQPKPMHRILPNFKDMCTPRGSRADKILGVSGNGNTFQIFGGPCTKCKKILKSFVSPKDVLLFSEGCCCFK